MQSRVPLGPGKFHVVVLVLRQMASSEDSENQYLRHLYECLAVAIDETDFSGFFSSLFTFGVEESFEMATEDLRRFPQQVRLQLYGSSAEDLHVDAFPDFDVMIFPTADELMIDDELIEFIPSNPLYVRIRGTGHPVLQSCLMEATEYVATSALKNFHPAIFGFGPIGSINNANNEAPTPIGFISASVNNEMTSPAVKLTTHILSNLEAGAFWSKLLNELKLALHKYKQGEEESIDFTDCLSREANSEAKILADCIPAFRCLTWPTVAQEWRKRQRKWPSPDVVDQVIREGFHLVVKAPKNGGNPECDFRISFSHAEYLLSQEINEIQRECYRCLKTYHRVYLSTEAKGLISFHLKNIFLRTIEETGGEMWIESRRAECMWKLFANLLKALRERHLPHYFVRSYNLFGIDYIKDPAILESLTQRVEQIMENPVKFAEELILVTRGKRSSPVQEQEQMNSPFNQQQLEWELMSLSSSKKIISNARIRKVCIGTVKDLMEVANNADCILENLDPMERTVVEDLRELQSLQEKDLVSVIYLVTLVLSFALLSSEFTWNLNDMNLRHHVLTCVKQVTQLDKYFMRLKDREAAKGPDIWRQMLNPASENPFVWNLLLPPGHGLEGDMQELLWTLGNCFVNTLLDTMNSNEDDIPLD